MGWVRVRSKVGLRRGAKTTVGVGVCVVVAVGVSVGVQTTAAWWVCCT